MVAAFNKTVWNWNSKFQYTGMQNMLHEFHWNTGAIFIIIREYLNNIF